MRINSLEILIVFSAVLLGISGCSVISSHDVSFLNGDNQPRQGAGAYQLPKHILLATVTSTGNGPYNLTLVRKTIADPRYQMNVGVNLSPTSDDEITIAYEKGLITSITSVVEDRTDEIIVNLTKAFYTNIPRSAEVKSSDQPRKIIQIPFDPFNFRALQDANQRLSRLGFCIAFAPNANEPFPQGCKDSFQSTRDLPFKANEFTGYRSEDIDSEPIEVRDGIFYRQPIEHKVRIYQFNAPERSCRKRWCTISESFIPFANNGKLLAVNVNRTMFVKHETTISFGSDGVPTSVYVKKPSEGLAASLLPLNVMKAIISAPAEALTESTTTINAQKDNITAKTQLLASQKTYIENLNTLVKNGQEVPAGHDIGAVLGTTPIRTVNVVGDGPGANVRSTKLENSKNLKRNHFILCSEVGLDQGGCEGLWRDRNPL